MPDFYGKLTEAQKWEHAVGSFLTTKNCKVLHYNDDKKYDIKYSSCTRNKLYQVEVKHDKQSSSTDNFVIESHSYGKPAGLSATTAEWFCYGVPDGANAGFYWFKTDVLKEIVTKRDLGNVCYLEGIGENYAQDAWLINISTYAVSATTITPYEDILNLKQ